MARLTIRNSDGTVSQPTNLRWADALERLAYYEDMEEQGRLVVLPCALETDIFRVGKKTVFGDWQVAYAEVYPDAIIMIDDSDNHFEADDIGKTVFLTREDAERALKEGADHE